MAKERPAQIVWFRQDLRFADQAALAAAAAAGPVLAVYVLDDHTPGDWRIGGAQRWWLHHSLDRLTETLEKHGVPLVLRRGRTADEIARLAGEIGAEQVHCLTHYEPWWKAAEEALESEIALVRHPGYLLAEPDRVRTGAGKRFRIFTPYWRVLSHLLPPEKPRPAPRHMTGLADPPRGETLASLKLLPTAPNWTSAFTVWTPGEAGATSALKGFVGRVGAYDHDRNLPSIDGSSGLSPHLHMGEVSPAAVWHAVAGHKGADSFLRELGWRDFTSGLIDQLPGYGDENGRDRMNTFPWRTGSAADLDFRAWTKGRTGYPIVDAGMRQLWRIGWMHNRVRMITASFLIKHLLIDWRRGERWFWDTLVDADYGNNSVNWQWVAGTGVDSSPFGRIMAPLGQSAKFDAAGYIRRWVPELAGLDDRTIHDPHEEGVAPDNYPDPLVGHREGRERALAAAARVKGVMS